MASIKETKMENQDIENLLKEIEQDKNKSGRHENLIIELHPPKSIDNFAIGQINQEQKKDIKKSSSQILENKIQNIPGRLTHDKKMFERVQKMEDSLIMSHRGSSYEPDKPCLRFSGSV